MLLKVFILALDGWLFSVADEASITQLIVDLLLDVSQLSELVNDDGGDDVGEEDVEEGPMNSIWEEPSVVACFSFARWRFSNDPLGVKRINAGEDRSAMRFYVSNVHIDWLILVQDSHVVVDTQKAEDKGKSCGKQANNQQFGPSQANSCQDIAQRFYLREYVKQH